MIRKEFLVSGRVQGVGFRFFCMYQASLLSLTGYAENLDDGQVLIEVQGDESSIRKFKTKILNGNGFSRVISIDEKDLTVDTHEKRFSTY
ncbi:acylphosphatase [Clostridium perfringens]|uniref:acylphosphatase n=1 Tax=Clostridium perfringens TaxID=1502 RepID=UPI000E16C29E|nr:acylphosphatase [Clostridium perfringens]SUY31432.1 acylphosphatase [Clostridium perfringens]